MRSAGIPWAPSRAAVIAAALVAGVVFAPALQGGFVHDDTPQIVANPLLQDLRWLPTLWSTGVWAGAGSGSSFYRPLFTSSLALDIALFGLAPAALHAVQLAFYAALAALAAWLVRRVAGDARVAFVAGLLFAAHPVNAEVAAWISARPDLLAALGTLLALHAHRSALHARGGAALAFALLTALAFGLALFAKESALAALVGIAALDRVHGASLRPRALLRRHAGLAAAGLLYGALRVRALGSAGGGLAGALDPWIVLGAAGQGALRLAWPAALTIAPPGPQALHVVLGVLLVLAGGAALVAALRRRTPLLVPLALGLAQLAIAALAAARIGELGDRYLLVPSLCAAWLAGHGAAALASRVPPLALRSALAAVALALSLAATRHVRVYLSDEILWRAAWSRNPASSRAAVNLASARLDAGDPVEALRWLERAESLSPGDPWVALNRAAAAQALGDDARAREILLGLVARAPAYWPAQLRLGHLALERDDLAEAQERYEAALRGNALAAEAWAGLGVTRARQGRAGEARFALERALALDPRVQNAPALRRMLEGLPR